MGGFLAGEREPNVELAWRAVGVEDSKRLAWWDLAVVGVAAGVIEAGDAFEDVVLRLGRSIFAGVV